MRIHEQLGDRSRLVAPELERPAHSAQVRQKSRVVSLLPIALRESEFEDGLGQETDGILLDLLDLDRKSVV